MKKIYSSMLLSCLVTLTLPVYIYAQEEEAAEQTEMVSCEQEAKDMGITDQQELANYIQECESAMSGESMSDMPEMSDTE